MIMVATPLQDSCQASKTHEDPVLWTRWSHFADEHFRPGPLLFLSVFQSELGLHQVRMHSQASSLGH